MSGWERYVNPVAIEPSFDVPAHIKLMLEKAQLPMDKDGLLMLQQNHKKQLDYFKETEMELRNLCIKFLFPTKKEGVNTVELGGGYTVKAGIAFNYRLDGDNNKIEDVLDDITKIGNEGAFISDRVITWTANFHVAEYRKLQDDASKGNQTAVSILNKLEQILTITDKAPTLEVKAPKNTK